MMRVHADYTPRFAIAAPGAEAVAAAPGGEVNANGSGSGAGSANLAAAPPPEVAIVDSAAPCELRAERADRLRRGAILPGRGESRPLSSPIRRGSR